MAIKTNTCIDPDSLMSVHQCRDCNADPPECTDEIKRTCPFYRIRNDPENETC